jgi:hypothetical protein
MMIFQLNRKRDHKFVFSALLFGFCMARITALVLRIVWASRQTNVSVAIAANVFTAAGVVLLFIVNLVFAARLVRAYHPHVGWHPACRWAFRLCYVLVGACLVLAIVPTVQSFFTIDPDTRRIDRDIQLVATVALATLAFLPTPITLLALLTPRRTRVEKFGQGRFRTKVRLLLFTSLLLTVGAAFRTAVAFATRPINDPGWWHHKACYYCFNYVIELIVVYTYAAARFDRRFHVPNGSSGPGHYAGGARTQKEASFAERVNAEGDVFGGDDSNAPVSAVEAEPEREQDWEKRAEEELGRESRLEEA